MKLLLYLRLSKEDRDITSENKTESNSISNQKNLILEYISTHSEFEKAEIITLVDDGFSGTNANRPQFQKMIEMSKKCEFDVLFVKDFSRFARDHILVCQYIEEIFPFLGIRFIAINEGFDSALARGKISTIELGFRNIVNSYYSHDLSKKLKTAKKIQAQNGKLLSGKPPFGYKKTAKNTYEIEIISGEIVQYIFQLAHSGMSLNQIAQRLNREKIPSKSMVKKEVMGEPRNPDLGQGNLWKYGEIYRVIHDIQYLGHYVYGKTEKPKISQKQQVSVPEKDWIVVENNHPPLVSEAVFQAVQSRFPVKKGSPKVRKNHLFQGLIRCGICHYALVRGKNLQYYCKTPSFAPDATCPTQRISEEEILSQLWPQIQEKLPQRSLKQTGSKENQTELISVKKSKNKLQILEQDLEKLEQKKMELFEIWLEEKISQPTYEKEKEYLEKEMKKQKIAYHLEKNQEIVGKNPDNLNKIMEKPDQLSRDTLAKLIQRIEVSPEKKIKVFFRE